MVSRFLCTTALEASWRTDEPVLFLGEWCRRHSRRARWETLDAQVLPYHWDDRARLHADYLYLKAFHERLLPALAVQLNELHGVDHNVRYWRVLVGPWLGYFVQMLFDRWTSIQEALRNYPIHGTVVLRDAEDSVVPNDMAEFPRLFASDEWNHHLYGEILQRYTELPCEIVNHRVPRPAATSDSATLKGAIGQRVAAVLARIAGSLARDDDAFFLATYLPFAVEVTLCRRFAQAPQRWRSIVPVRTPADDTRRRWVVEGENTSDFEACARAMIARQIPTAYLEGYAALREQVAALPWPARPKVIWTAIAHNSDDVFKAWAADKVERGAPLVVGQHGGHYGVGRWSFTEEHDLAISDGYLSWGWTDPAQPRIRPVGQLKAKRPLGIRHARQPRALLVTCSLPRFSYWMYSVPVARQWLDYFDDQCAFVAALPGNIRKALTVRLYPTDFGWDQASRLRERFPDLEPDSGRAGIDDLLKETRVFVCTYNATTYLESFTMNVPTVMYWNPAHWELREQALQDFDELRRVGILHATPESAARHLAAIWNDVDAWWSSRQLQDALAGFKRRYCHLSDGLRDHIEHALRDVIAATGRRLAQ